MTKRLYRLVVIVSIAIIAAHVPQPAHPPMRVIDSIVVMLAVVASCFALERLEQSR